MHQNVSVAAVSIHAARRKAASVVRKLAAARNLDDENQPTGKAICLDLSGLVFRVPDDEQFPSKTCERSLKCRPYYRLRMPVYSPPPMA